MSNFALIITWKLQEWKIKVEARPGGVLPYICHIGKWVELLRRFRLKIKTGIHFAHFGLESGIVFDGTTECMNVFIVSIPNEYERKRNMRIRNGFE